MCIIRQECEWQISILRDWLQQQGIHDSDNTIAKMLDKLNYVYKGFSETMLSDLPSPAEKKQQPFKPLAIYNCLDA